MKHEKGYLIEFCGITIGSAETFKLDTDGVLRYYAKEIYLYPKYAEKLNNQLIDAVWIDIYSGDVDFLKNYEVKHTEKFMTFCS